MIGYGCSSELPLDDIRRVAYAQQREERGFDDTETWSLRSSIARFLVPRLKRFKELTICHPESITMEEWNTILQQMIDGFEHLLAHEDAFDVDEAKVDLALELFKTWYWDLWW